MTGAALHRLPSRTGAELPEARIPGAVAGVGDSRSRVSESTSFCIDCLFPQFLTR